jgi:hypothetical protein
VQWRKDFNYLVTVRMGTLNFANVVFISYVSAEIRKMDVVLLILTKTIFA